MVRRCECGNDFAPYNRRDGGLQTKCFSCLSKEGKIFYNEDGRIKRIRGVTIW